MRAAHFILFCSCFSFLKAYPVDFDEAIVNITEQALADLEVLLVNVLGDVHLEFISKKEGILNTTQRRLEKVYDTFNQRHTEIQGFADKANNTNISRCLSEDNIISPQTYLVSLNSTCNDPASYVGFNFRRLEENKRGHYFFQRHAELKNNLEVCLNFNDPQPYICAGLVASTLQEVERISPAVKAQPLQFNGELNQQLVAFGECASEQVSLYAKRLNVWHNNLIACVVDLINVNGKY